MENKNLYHIIENDIKVYGTKLITTEPEKILICDGFDVVAVIPYGFTIIKLGNILK